MDEEEEGEHLVLQSFDRNDLFAPISSSSLLLHQLLYSHHFPRWCFDDLEENPMDRNFTDVVIRAGKSLKFEMCDPLKAPTIKKSCKLTYERPKQSASSSEVIEQLIWKEFPEDLMEVVISRLPIDAFFRFRIVCRKWNSLLSSPSFSHHCAQIQQAQPWSFTITLGKIPMGDTYDPTTKKWYHLMIPPLPPELYLLPVASAGGLICLNDIGHKKFFVCNPLTQTWKELPGRSSVNVWSPIVVGMIWTKKSSADGYKIIWVGNDGKHEVYDPINDSWAWPGDIPPEISTPLSLKFKSQAVSINNTIYFLRSDPEGIVSYDVDSGVWKQFLVPNPPHSTYYTLAECEGRILLVGLLTKNAATCVCIWELQRMMLLWKEVDRMPNIWCLEFYGKHVSMNCLGNKGLLMLSVRSRMMNRVVAYDVAKKRWLKVPCCGKSQGRKRRWVAYGAAFYPCLTAVP